MVKPGCEVSGYSLSGLKMRWAAIWTVTQVSWQLWITPVRAMDGFSGKDTINDETLLAESLKAEDGEREGRAEMLKAERRTFNPCRLRAVRGGGVVDPAS